jgi:anthranilate synthase component I
MPAAARSSTPVGASVAEPGVQAESPGMACATSESGRESPGMARATSGGGSESPGTARVTPGSEGHSGAALPIEPTLEQARALAAESDGDGGPYNLIPLRHSFIEDCETPVSAFLKLRALAPSEPAFLLESADQGQRVGRWSFIGFRPRSVLRWSLGEGAGEGGGEDPYALLAERIGRFHQAPLSDAPPFTGGAVGFFGYDLVRTVEPLGPPNPDPLGLPDMALMLSDALVIFDHLKHTVTILANADLSESERSEIEIERAYLAATATIAEIREALAGPVPRVDPARASREMPEFQSNMPRSQFEGMVERIVKYIYAGDAFQVVPSQRWSAPVPIEAFSIYRGLRAVNPSPYMYFLDFGDFQVAGASPEPLLTVGGGGASGPPGRVSTRPIAGTRPRGADAQEDERIARELLEDPKERAEHVMLVDLGRNDLGRVCQAGSVEVESFMAVETYSHVMHIVSSVAGRLREGVTPMDALRSVLPAGTLSGAPKVRAMQIIDELEPIKRGGYGGAIGYLSYAGDLDTCIHIRTVVVKDGVAHIQAGGGTVADAKPAYEYEESRAKSRAVLRAIELAISQPDWP